MSDYPYIDYSYNMSGDIKGRRYGDEELALRGIHFLLLPRIPMGNIFLLKKRFSKKKYYALLSEDNFEPHCLSIRDEYGDVVHIFLGGYDSVIFKASREGFKLKIGKN